MQILRGVRFATVALAATATVILQPTPAVAAPGSGAQAVAQFNVRLTRGLVLQLQREPAMLTSHSLRSTPTALTPRRLDPHVDFAVSTVDMVAPPPFAPPATLSMPELFELSLTSRTGSVEVHLEVRDGPESTPAGSTPHPPHRGSTVSGMRYLVGGLDLSLDLVDLGLEPRPEGVIVTVVAESF